MTAKCKNISYTGSSLHSARHPWAEIEGEECACQCLGNRPPDKRPVPPTDPGQDNCHNQWNDLASNGEAGQGAKSHVPSHQSLMLNSQATDDKRKGQPRRDS